MSGSHRTPGRGYRDDDVPGSSSGEYDARRGYPPAGGADDGYRTSGGYPTASGGYRTSSGGYRTASGTHRTSSGSHRSVATEPRWGWRMALVIAGAVAGVAACAVVVVLVMGRAAHTTADGSARHAAAQKASSSTGKEFTIVPDSCSLISNDQATQLVASFQQNPSTASDTDQHSQCVWTDFSAGSGRQLTVELRLIAASGGKSAASAAHDLFVGEQAGDNSNGGTALDPNQTLAAHEPLSGIGDEAYITYSTDDTQAFGETGVNLRSANLLVTVRYGGSSGSAPLDQQKATDGAKQAAQDVMAALAKA